MTAAERRKRALQIAISIAVKAETARCAKVLNDEITHIEKNGRNVSKLPGGEVEGRCRILCAMYLREFVASIKTESALRESRKDSEDAARYRKWRSFAKPAYVAEAISNEGTASLECRENITVYADSWDAMDEILLRHAAIERGGGEDGWHEPQRRYFTSPFVP